MDPGLVNYVRRALQEGSSKKKITETLLKGGWNQGKVNEIFAYLSSPPEIKKKSSQAIVRNKPSLSGVVIAFVVLIVVAGSASAALYTGKWNTTWNPFRPNPQEIFIAAIDTFEGIETFHVGIAINAQSQGEAATDLALTIAVESDVRTGGGNDGTSSGTFSLDFATQGIMFHLAGETIIIGDKLYLKATTVPLFPLFDLSTIQGTWIEFSRESQTVSVSNSRELTAQIKKLIQDDRNYDISAKSDKTIDNVRTYHYVLTFHIDIDKLLAESGIQQVMLSSGDFLQEFQDIPLEVWIGKDDLKVRKMQLTKTVSGVDTQVQGTADVVFSATLTFSNFNEPIEQITPPQDAQTFEEISNLLIPGVLPPDQ